MTLVEDILRRYPATTTLLAVFVAMVAFLAWAEWSR